MTDAIVRLLPGAMGDETSALSDSFQDGLLEPGVYTRPADYKGWKVPEILLSGHQAKIEEWLYEESVRHTMERRPDLLEEWFRIKNFNQGILWNVYHCFLFSVW